MNEMNYRPDKELTLSGLIRQQAETEADFTYSIRGNVISIVDLDQGNRSVTNDVERVLVQKLETGGWPRYRRRMAELPSAQELFKGRHFDREIIILCVRWYLTFKLSSRDLVQMMAERGIGLAHTTILRWIQRYVPEFEKRWQAYARPVGRWGLLAGR
jgi:hypothetical protein